MPSLVRSALSAAVLIGAALSALPARAAGGDVRVEPVGRRGLAVVGDEVANDLVIDVDPLDADTWIVRGQAGTTVNGQVEIRVARPRKLLVELGKGDDALALGPVRIEGRLQVDLGEGDDVCTFFASRLNGRTRIDGGSGDDAVTAEARTRFGGALRVSLDDGDDVLRLDDGVLRGRTRLLTGDGDDRVDLIRQGAVHTAPVIVRTGRDADAVRLQGCTFQSGVRVLTVAGTDDVLITTSHFEKGLVLDTGKDQDEAHLEHSSFEGAFKMIGGRATASGSATLVIVNVSFGITSDKNEKFTWSVVVVHRFP